MEAHDDQNTFRPFGWLETFFLILALCFLGVFLAENGEYAFDDIEEFSNTVLGPLYLGWVLYSIASSFKWAKRYDWSPIGLTIINIVLYGIPLILLLLLEHSPHASPDSNQQKAMLRGNMVRIVPICLTIGVILFGLYNASKG